MQRRKQEDQDAQHDGGKGPAEEGIPQLSQAVFHLQRGADKVQRAQAAKHAQQHVKRHIPQIERHHGSGKGALPSQAQDTDQGGRYGTEHERQDTAHGKVEQQDFQREQHACQRRVEDARYGTGRAAPQQERHAAVGHAAVAAQVGADGRARVHDGGLRTDGTAEANGERTSQERAPAIVALDFGFVLGNGLQHLGNAMANVVPDKIPDDEKAQEHAHAGQHQIGPAAPRHQLRNAVLNAMDSEFEPNCGQAAQGTGDNGKDQKRRSFRHLMQKAPDGAPYPFYATTVCHGGYSSSEPLEYWAMLSSGRVSPAASEASALPPATASFSASSSPSSQRATSSRSSVFTLIFTR